MYPSSVNNTAEDSRRLPVIRKYKKRKELKKIPLKSSIHIIRVPTTRALFQHGFVGRNVADWWIGIEIPRFKPDMKSMIVAPLTNAIPWWGARGMRNANDISSSARF